MEYGRLTRAAWTITWRSRFLWLLGLLAGGGSVMVPTGGGGGRQSTQSPADKGTDLSWLNSAMAATGSDLSAWAVANIGLLVAVAILAIGVVVALIVSSLIARGGLARATVDLATGRGSSLASAWGAGVHLFWRYVGLYGLLIGAALLVACALGMVVAVAVVASALAHSPLAGITIAIVVEAAAVATFVSFVLEVTRANPTPRWKVALTATLFAVPIFPVLVVVGLTLSIVVAFAQRAIAVEDVGPMEALSSGWRLMRTHIAESLMTWLINAGLALVSGIAGFAAAIGGLAAFAAAGALTFATNGVGAPLFAYAGVGGLLLVIGGLTVVGIVNTFFWTYWTLVYLRLSGRGVPMEAVS